MFQRTLIIAGLSLLLATPALAAGKMSLTSRAEIEVTQISPKGQKETKRLDAAKANVAPGDAVIFTTDYLNQGEQPATDVVITNPIPEHMLYLDDSAEGAGTRIVFSIDGGRSYAAPDQLVVKLADGKERPARGADYTHIRWILEGAVAPKGTGSVSFRAKVK